MRKYVSAVLVLILVISIWVVVDSNLIAGEKQKSEWNMFRRNIQHTGEIQPKYAPRLNRVRNLWSFKAGDTVLSSPSIVNDKVFVGSHDHRMYCLDAYTGEKIWEYRTKDIVKSSPLIKGQGVYFGSLDGTFHCVDIEDGEVIWQFDTKRNGGIAGSPAVSGSSIFFGTLDGFVFCLDMNSGEEFWRYDNEDQITSSPTISNGMVIVGTRDFKLLCLDEFSGEDMWSIKLDGSVYSSVSVLNSNAYVGCDGKKLYCINVDRGEIVWEFDTDNVIRSTPTIASGYVLFSSGYDLYCLNQDGGTPAWHKNIGAQGVSSISASGDKVYTSMGTMLMCFDIDTGEEIWHEKLESDCYSPSIAYNKLYLGTKDGYVHCFDDNPIPFEVNVSPSVVDLGEQPPNATVSGKIRISVPPNDDVEMPISLGVEIEKEGDWFQINYESKTVEGGTPLEFTVTTDDSKLRENNKWYSGRIIFLVVGIEYPVVVKVYTDSSLEISDDNGPVVSKNSCQWTTIGGSPEQNNCSSEFCGPEEEMLSLLWEHEFSDSLNETPLVSDGKVFITPSYTNKINCFDIQTGELIWNTEIEGYVNDNSALFGGMLYIPTNNGLTCISQKNGDMSWQFETDSTISSPVTVTNGKVLFGLQDGKILCLNKENGTEFWTFSGSDESASTAIATNTSNAFFGCADGFLYAINLDTGERVWAFDTGDHVSASPACIGDKIILGTMNKRLYCFQASNGEQLWFANTYDKVKVSPAVTENRVFLYSDDGMLRCYSTSDGDLIWDKELFEDIEGHPSVSGKKLYIGTWDKKVHCFDTVTGAYLWNHETDKKIRAPIVISTGKVIVCSGNKLICFGDPPPDIIIEPEIIDFGGIDLDLGIDHIRELHLENTTENTFEIEIKVDEDIEWFVALESEFSLGPGEKKIVPIATIENKVPGGMPSDYLYVTWDEVVVPVKVRAYVLSNSTLMVDDWLCFGKGHDRRSFTQPHSGPETDELKINWYTETELETDSSPVLNRDLLFCGFGNRFYCFDPLTGAYKWFREFDRDGFSSAGCCTGIGGSMVLFGSADGNMNCLDAETGAKEWSFQTGGPVFSSPIIHEKKFDPDEPRQRRVYFGSLDNRVYSLLADNGELVWEFMTDGRIYSSPCVPPYGDQIFIGSTDEYVYAIDTMTGKENWRYKTDGAVYSTPTNFFFEQSNSDGTYFENHVYVGSNDGHMYCIDGEKGKLAWKYDTGSPIVCSPALYDGKLFFGNLDGDFYILSRVTGEKIKMLKLGSQVRSSPSINARHVYITTNNGRIYNLDCDNLEILWHSRIGSGSRQLQSSPALWKGNLYIGDMDGNMYCFSAKPPDVEFINDTIDFGICKPNSLKTSKLTIKNNSDRPITISFDDVYEWFDIGMMDMTIQPGEEISNTFSTISSELEKTGTYYGGSLATWTDGDGETVSQRIPVLIVIK
jgi:eukaryotic-like serine/threonine-protein kinase